MINDSLLSNLKSMNVGVPPIKTIEEMFTPVAFCFISLS